MPVTFVGITFGQNSQWYQDENDLIDNLRFQIQSKFAQSKNLLVNLTWFGPQFDNGQYEKFLDITAQEKFQRIFLLAAADPVMLNEQQITDMIARSGATESYRCGHFDSKYQFNFHSLVLPKYFQSYENHELEMISADYLFLCLNRKPRGHRLALVQKLLAHGFDNKGVITLGRQDSTYNQESHNDLFFTLNESPDGYAKAGNWNLPMTFGIPHDIHSLGNMDIWRRHFLNIVGETEFLPWDNLFVSEKTWKPILGLRPFVVNGQTQVYSWLRQHGFRTFERYWPRLAMENLPEHAVHDSIIALLQFLKCMDKRELEDMYADMRPDLIYNRERFFEFSNEQHRLVDDLFSR